MDAKRIARTVLVAGSLGLSFPALVSAQPRVGIVTNVEGTAMVARLTTPEPQALQTTSSSATASRPASARSCECSWAARPP